MKFEEFEVVDAHTHFFSYTWMENFCKLATDKFSREQGVEELASFLDWEAPPVNPRELGERWIDEQEIYGVSKQVLFASKLNDAEYLTAATSAFPDRLIGYVLIDPTEERARANAVYSINILGMRGMMLFPAMHHYHVYDDRVLPVLEEALSCEVPVFIHFGELRIPIFEKLGIPSHIDLSYSNPLDLKRVAGDYKEVRFIIPHFGCGKFDEALEVAKEFENVYVDTSSSNSWIPEPETLETVFKRTLKTIGPERVLFGTDSSYFPRGWRKDIFDEQRKIIEEIGLSHEDKQLIFAGNIKRILRLT
jgi:predicted TIM-barrel fold metal-dependent hydrolase